MSTAVNWRGVEWCVGKWGGEEASQTGAKRHFGLSLWKVLPHVTVIAADVASNDAAMCEWTKYNVAQLFIAFRCSYWSKIRWLQCISSPQARPTHAIGQTLYLASYLAACVILALAVCLYVGKLRGISTVIAQTGVKWLYRNIFNFEALISRAKTRQKGTRPCWGIRTLRKCRSSVVPALRLPRGKASALRHKSLILIIHIFRCI